MPVYVPFFQAQIYVLPEKGVQNGGQWDKDKHSHNSHQISANCHSRKHPDGGQPDRAADFGRDTGDASKDDPRNQDEIGEKNRLQLYRFLVDAASDGLVGIPLLPGTKKLGDERAGVSASALAGEGMLSELYRERKLMQRYLEVAALKNDLTPSEAYLLLCLSQAGR